MEPGARAFVCFRLGEGADCESWSLEEWGGGGVGGGRSYLVTAGFHIFQGPPGK